MNIELSRVSALGQIYGQINTKHTFLRSSSLLALVSQLVRATTPCRALAELGELKMNRSRASVARVRRAPRQGS